MILKTLAVAALMIVVGVYGYTNQPEVEGKSPSPTAAIPAVFGVIFALGAVVAVVSPSRRKLAMHVVAGVSLLGAIGSLYPIMSLASKGTPIDLATVKVQTSLASAILCVLLLVFCVYSFISARLNPKT
jgi:drug/metabolite transporter (DMT)-like permease